MSQFSIVVVCTPRALLGMLTIVVGNKNKPVKKRLKVRLRRVNGLYR